MPKVKGAVQGQDATLEKDLDKISEADKPKVTPEQIRQSIDAGAFWDDETFERANNALKDGRPFFGNIQNDKKLQEKIKESVVQTVIPPKPEPEQPEKDVEPVPEEKQEDARDAFKEAAAQAKKEQEGEEEQDVPETEIDYDTLSIKGTKLKWAGKEVTLKNKEEAINLMQMGLDYTFKTQMMRDDVKFAEEVRRLGFTPEYINGLQQGDKRAFKRLLDKFNIDPIDLVVDEDSSPDDEIPIPGTYQRPEFEESRAPQVHEEVAQNQDGKAPIDKSMVALVQDVMQNNPKVWEEAKAIIGYLPKNVQEYIASDAQRLSGFLVDTESGYAKQAVLDAALQASRLPEWQREYLLENPREYLANLYAAGYEAFVAEQNKENSMQQAQAEKRQVPVRQFDKPTSPPAASRNAGRINEAKKQQEEIWTDEQWRAKYDEVMRKN